jgi:hypothetical protein
MAKSTKQGSTAGLSSKARAKVRGTGTPLVSFAGIHKAIRSARSSLLSKIPADEVGKERVIAAIRNLDVARVVLECNQSLSATDYNVEPWRHIGSMNALTATKKRAGK